MNLQKAQQEIPGFVQQKDNRRFFIICFLYRMTYVDRELEVFQLAAVSETSNFLIQEYKVISTPS